MLTDLEVRLLGIMMIIIMFGMGASLTFKDFAIALKKPQGILVGLLCQYGLMPFVAFSLGIAFGFTPGLLVGIVLMGCMPGGTTSNIFTYFSKGRLSLSILMTVASTLVAIVMVPITLGIYGAGIEGDWRIPQDNIVQVLFVLLVPTVLGLLVRKGNANVGAVIELIGSLLGVVVIIFLIASWVPRNWQLLLETGGGVYAGAIGLGLVGFALAYGLARLFRQDALRSRTISIETGIQNGPLAILIVVLTFTDERQTEVLMIPILYSLFIVLTSTVLTLWFRRITWREQLARDAAKIGSMREAA